MTIELGSLIAVIGTMAGVVFGYIGHQRIGKKEIQSDTKDHTELKTNLDYIRKGVDDIRIDQRAADMRIGEISERLIRTEESTKQSHKRIDRLEGK